MTPEARETGLGGQIDGVLQEYKVISGKSSVIKGLNNRNLTGQNPRLALLRGSLDSPLRRRYSNPISTRI